MTALLSPTDLEVVHETLQEIRDMPPPRDNHAAGCAMVVAGIAVLVVLPALAGVLPDAAGGLGLLLGGALTVVGIITWMTAAGFVRGHTFAAAEAALRELEGWSPQDGDRQVALRAATLLLTHAVAEHGPTSTSTFERAEAERRITPMMPLVMAVQGVLVEEDAAYPIFGTEEEDDSEHDSDEAYS